MTATPQSTLESRLKTLDKSVENSEITESDAEAIRTFIAAYNPNDLLETPPGDDSTLELGSCNAYLQSLTVAARRISLAEATADDVNGVLQALNDEGQSPWTVHGYSTAFKKFYGYHEGGPKPGDITQVKTPDGSSFDADDLLTPEQIHEFLDAAGNPRDRAVAALFIYTGMRNQALRSLRVGDIDLRAGSSGTWKVPDEAEGLKGLGENGDKRPLLGAKGPVREWLSYHPASDDPDAHLITGRPKYGKADPSNPIDGSTVRRVLDRLAENSDNPEIQRKPTNPHMMRHNFVTVCKREHKLPDETVKHLIGHSDGSKVMQTTYSHLSDDDHIERAEVAAGMRDPDEGESPLTPPACTTCGEPLSPSAKACERCGDVFAPNAKGVAEQAVGDVASSDLPPELRQAVVQEILGDNDLKRQLAEEVATAAE